MKHSTGIQKGLTMAIRRHIKLIQQNDPKRIHSRICKAKTVKPDTTGFIHKQY